MQALRDQLGRLEQSVQAATQQQQGLALQLQVQAVHAGNSTCSQLKLSLQVCPQEVAAEAQALTTASAITQQQVTGLQEESRGHVEHLAQLEVKVVSNAALQRLAEDVTSVSKAVEATREEAQQREPCFPCSACTNEQPGKGQFTHPKWSIWPSWTSRWCPMQPCSAWLRT